MEGGYFLKTDKTHPKSFPYIQRRWGELQEEV